MPADKNRIGPIPLEPIYVERIWGTDALGPWYPKPPEGKPIGEVWLTAEECVASEGQFRGKRLDEIVRGRPDVLGPGAGEEAQFPLLVKVLYPREKLSVQVHPGDAEAQARGEPRGKTECWYVLSAEPGAAVALGFREEMSPEQIRAAIADQTLEDKLRYVPVNAGDLVFVDAGTVHAIGPGMVVLETQQYSDTTYRLYDYGRPRELHVDQGLAVTRTSTAAGLIEPVQVDGFTRLVASRYFVVDKFTVGQGEPVRLGGAGAQLLVALREGAFLVDGDGVRTTLKPGYAVLLPAEEVGYFVDAEAAAEVVRIAER